MNNRLFNCIFGYKKSYPYYNEKDLDIRCLLSSESL